MGHRFLTFLFVITVFLSYAMDAVAQRISDPKSIDIVGLRLGMSRSEAEIMLMKHNKNFKIYEKSENIIYENNNGPIGPIHSTFDSIDTKTLLSKSRTITYKIVCLSFCCF